MHAEHLFFIQNVGCANLAPRRGPQSRPPHRFGKIIAEGNMMGAVPGALLI